VVVGLLLGGCTFDSSTPGGAGGVGEEATGTSDTVSTNPTTDTSASGSMTTMPATTDDSDSSDPPPTTSANGTSSGDAEGTSAASSSSTREPFDCEGEERWSGTFWIEDATEVVQPMVRVEAWGGLSGDPQVAYSDTGGAGTVTLALDVPCDRDYYLWGVIWDRYAGAPSCGGVANPDRYWVQVDGGAETDWRFACNTCGARDSTWSWARVETYMGSPCATQPLVISLTAGAHTLRFRNEEAGTFDPPENPNVAAIAAVAVSTEADYDPSTDYVP
jgi:hypothetical protein